MILALSYVLIFPTLMSAMTGYSGTSWHSTFHVWIKPSIAYCRSDSATTQPYIQIADGSEIEWSSFRLINYIIYDGWRVGLTGDYLVNAVSCYATCTTFSISIFMACPYKNFVSLKFLQADPSDYPDADVCSSYSTSSTGVVELLNAPEKLEDCLLTVAVSQCKTNSSISENLFSRPTLEETPIPEAHRLSKENPIFLRFSVLSC